MLPLSLKSMRQSKVMQQMQPEIARIEKKYAGRTDNEAMMAKSQETMMVYQKYKINPVSGCLIALIQIPLFFAFLSAINKVPADSFVCGDHPDRNGAEYLSFSASAFLYFLICIYNVYFI